jgi:hypothetical protein
MEKLIELGFKQSAIAEIVNDTFVIKIEKNEHSTNLLYAFILINGENWDDWQVRYIGHTRKSFKNRMYGYQQGNGQAINNRLHTEVKNHCLEGSKVVIYTLTEAINLSLYSLFIDVAAGLEYSLIEYYQTFNSKNNHPPLQNIAGNKNHIQINELKIETLEIEEKVEEDKQYKLEDLIFDIPKTIEKFEQDLGRSTYWDFPTINIPTEFSQYFGNHEEVACLTIIEKEKLQKEFSVKINRTAVKNGTPRLYVSGNDGRWFQDWKHINFKRDGKIVFHIISLNKLYIILN